MKLTCSVVCTGAVEQCCLDVLAVDVQGVSWNEAGVEAGVDLCARSKRERGKDGGERDWGTGVVQHIGSIGVLCVSMCVCMNMCVRCVCVCVFMCVC